MAPSLCWFAPSMKRVLSHTFLQYPEPLPSPHVSVTWTLVLFPSSEPLLPTHLCLNPDIHCGCRPRGARPQPPRAPALHGHNLHPGVWPPRFTGQLRAHLSPGDSFNHFHHVHRWTWFPIPVTSSLCLQVPHLRSSSVWITFSGKYCADFPPVQYTLKTGDRFRTQWDKDNKMSWFSKSTRLKC